MTIPPYSLQPEPLSKSWIERHPGWKIPLGCLILLLLVGGFVTILLTGILASFHSSDVYNQALARAAADPQVRAHLGEPVHPGWFISGQMNVSGSAGNADLSIPVSGPRGKGVIRAVAVKSEGVWRFTTLQVNIEGESEPLDLLSVQPPAEREF
jgi:Cytochrome oxidase complex assembly protein 1